MGRWSRLVLFLIVNGVVGLLSGTSEAQWALYDDFSSRPIDPARWFGGVVTGGPTNPTLETIRAIKGGKLRLLVNQYGRTDSSSGTSSGQSRLAMSDPTAISAMRARVTVTSALAEACPANASTTVRARAQLSGGFFNDGAGSAGDRTGDILGVIQKMTDTHLGNVIQAFVQRCANVACSSLTTLASPLFATTWAPGQTHRLTLVWDEVNDRFVFSAKAPGLPAETIVVTNPSLSVKATTVPYRLLGANVSAANCEGSQKRAFMDAFFDDVSVSP